MAEVFLECTHSLTQQVKKKKKKKRRTKPFGNQEGERLLPEFNCAEEEKRIPAATVDATRTERETSVVVLNCKTSNSKPTNGEKTTKRRGMTPLIRLLFSVGADTNRLGDERSRWGPSSAGPSWRPAPAGGS